MIGMLYSRLWIWVAESGRVVACKHLVTIHIKV